MFTQEYLKEILRYDPETGNWFWKVSRASNKIKPGARAGGLDKSGGSRGVWKITIDNKRYGASRLAFLFMIGRFPYPDTVHVNRDTSDNRWENLKEGRHKSPHRKQKTRQF